jgi:predicted HicB family RNase H-like nuclease
MKKQKTQKLQSDQRTTKQVRIDAGLHMLLKIKAAQSNISIRELLEEYLGEFLGTDK